VKTGRATDFFNHRQVLARGVHLLVIIRVGGT